MLAAAPCCRCVALLSDWTGWTWSMK